MAQTNGYNGWNNYETWSIALWIDNDASLSQMVNEWNDESDDAWEMSRRIQEFFEEYMPELDGVWSQLLHAAFSEINWLEIGEHYYEESVDEDEE